MKKNSKKNSKKNNKSNNTDQNINPNKITSIFLTSLGDEEYDEYTQTDDDDLDEQNVFDDSTIIKNLKKLTKEESNLRCRYKKNDAPLHPSWSVRIERQVYEREVIKQGWCGKRIKF